MAGARRSAILAGLSLLALSGGCGGGDADDGMQTSSDRPQAGGGGMLDYALSEPPGSLDPLRATSRPAQLIVRQLNEPLVAQLHGPYGDTARRPGLAISWRPSADRTVWRFRLRRGVRFHDGSVFNAAAVTANWRRWRSSGAGSRLLPDLFAVDAPRPNEARFVLDRPRADLPELLSSPRLGIVSPRAMRPRSGEGARLTRQGGTGTGAFELGSRQRGSLAITRSPSWWGSPLGLGPALDSVRFRFVPGAGERERLLRLGEVDVAEPLGNAALRSLAEDPLLTTVQGPGRGIGLERSVRGIDSWREVVPLSGVWLTTVGEG